MGSTIRPAASMVMVLLIPFKYHCTVKWQYQSTIIIRHFPSAQIPCQQRIPTPLPHHHIPPPQGGFPHFNNQKSSIDNHQFSQSLIPQLQASPSAGVPLMNSQTRVNKEFPRLFLAITSPLRKEAFPHLNNQKSSIDNHQFSQSLIPQLQASPSAGVPPPNSQTHDRQRIPTPLPHYRIPPPQGGFPHFNNQKSSIDNHQFSQSLIPQLQASPSAGVPLANSQTHVSTKNSHASSSLSHPTTEASTTSPRPGNSR